MTHRSNSDLPPKLLQGRQAFEQWRNQQETRCRLPDHLWSLAVELAREYGFTKTAKTLRVEYNMLKKKSLSLEGPSGQPAAVPAEAFLELRPNAVPDQFECIIDCQRSLGQMIRIHLKGPHWPDVTGLCERLWGTSE
jgi:hypothetical protein